MTPKQLKEIGYPSNIPEMIENTEGVELIEENETYYLINDTYDDDRLLQINKEPDFKKDYFEFFDNDIDKDVVYSFVKTLPPILFMHLKKIYFVEKDEDLLGEVDEESPNHTFYFSAKDDIVGMAVYSDSVAFVNLRALRKAAKEEAEEDMRILGYTNGNYFMTGALQTLAHELFHLAQFNPLIETIIPAGEKPAEEFCRLTIAY